MGRQSAAWSTKQGPPAELWEFHRPTIKRLYFDEGNTLRNVAATMSTQYDFRASMKMYKSHITLWKLHKNNSEREVALILRKKQKRDAVGKTSAFTLRGRPVDYDDLIRFCRRRQRSGRPVQPASPAVSSDSDISCRTPSPTPVARSSLSSQTRQSIVYSRNINFPFLRYPRFPPSMRPITPPGDLLASELFFKYSLIYVQSAVGRGDWKLNDGGDLVLANDPFTLRVWGHPSDVMHRIHQARRLLDSKAYARARCVLSAVFESVRWLLLDEHPCTLETFLACFYVLGSNGYHSIAIMLQRFIGQMAEQVVDSSSIWFRVCQQIKVLDVQSSLLLSRSHKCLADGFEYSLSRVDAWLGPRLTAEPYVSTAAMERPCDRFDNLHPRLAHLSAFANADMRSLQGHAAQANRYLCARYLTAAENLAMHVVSHAQHESNRCLLVRSLLIAGACQYMMRRDTEAECTLRRAINLVSQTWGEKDFWTIDVTLILVEWLRNWGRDLEADALDEQTR